jgi:hypothetical protein
MTLKERRETARRALGAQKANSIIAALRHYDGRGPTLKMQCDALEDALAERFAQHATAAKPPVPITQHSSPAPASKSQVLELCAQYDALTNDGDRRAFWQKNERAFSGKISGLAEICMAAAKPLSFRARAGMQFSVAPSKAGPADEVAPEKNMKILEKIMKSFQNTPTS